MNKIYQTDYTDWLKNIKESVKNAQIKASISVNKELLILYFKLGLEIVEKQKNATWGNNFLGQLSKDLRMDFPYFTGFSKRNLEIIRQWVSFYTSNFLNTKQVVSQLNIVENEITKQLVSQLNDLENTIVK